MGTFTVNGGEFAFLWASDVDFDGIRLEVLSDKGEDLFHVGLPETGDLTVNTFSKEIPAPLIAAAIELAQNRREQGLA